MKIVDRNAKWVTREDGSRFGVEFDCPCTPGETCGGTLRIFFSNPLDGGKAAPVSCWTREGETLETLTLRPSIDTTHIGRWHGYVTNGEAVPC